MATGGEINPVYDDNGEFRYSACILNDITLIKAAEKNASWPFTGARAE